MVLIENRKDFLFGGILEFGPTYPGSCPVVFEPTKSYFLFASSG